MNIFTLCVLLCVKQVRSNLELQLEAELEEFAKKLRLNDTILKYEEFQHKLGDFETYPLISSVHHNSTLCEVHKFNSLGVELNNKEQKTFLAFTAELALHIYIIYRVCS